MPAIYVFEDSQSDRLAPLTYMRAACDLRVGMATFLERIVRTIGRPLDGLLVRSAVAELTRRRNPDIPVNPPLSAKEGIVLLNARWVPLGHQKSKDGWRFNQAT